ncbi:MAG: biotin synthase [Rubrivivax sp.]
MAAPPVSASVARVDPVALAQVRRRLARAVEPPWLHGEVARRMAERLPLVKLQPVTVLDWSGPGGASIAPLRAAYPRATLQAVQDDDMPAPPARPPRWWPFARAAAVEHRRMAEVPESAAQLLWSNMALHGHADLPDLLQRWHRAVAVGGFLMFSTLGPGSLAELRALYRQMGWPEPMAPLVDMHDLGDALAQAGFADPVMDQETLTLTWTEAPRLLAELRTLGGNVAPGRHPGLRTPRWREQLQEALLAHAVDGRMALSFEVVYGHAFRVARRARVAAETTLPLEDLRAQLKPGRTSST